MTETDFATLFRLFDCTTSEREKYVFYSQKEPFLMIDELEYISMNFRISGSHPKQQKRCNECYYLIHFIVSLLLKMNMNHFFLGFPKRRDKLLTIDSLKEVETAADEDKA